MYSLYISDLNYFFIEKGECLTRMQWKGQEELVLLKQISNSSSINHQIQINNEDLTQAECFTISENLQNSTTLEEFDTITLEEMLIEEVRKRPPIYDYTLPLSVRGRQKIIDLWKEISEALNGNYSA